jgi:hypothetical protein
MVIAGMPVLGFLDYLPKGFATPDPPMPPPNGLDPLKPPPKPPNPPPEPPGLLPDGPPKPLADGSLPVRPILLGPFVVVGIVAEAAVVAEL